MVKDDTSKNATVNNLNIALAANNAAAAAKAASEAASSAAANAVVAAKAAADSATAIAVVATDTSWMKKSLAGIEQTLDEMRNAYVSTSQHNEVLRQLENHEQRLNGLETEKTRVTVLLATGIGILTLLVSLLVWHLVGR
jgi:hypothetical protein